MANLYGRLQGNRGEVTRMGHYDIHSRLETWTGSIQTELYRDGTYRVLVGSKYNPTTLIATGNLEMQVDSIRQFVMMRIIGYT